MLRLAIVLFVLPLLVPSQEIGPTTPLPDCFTDTDLLYDYMAQKNIFEQVDYVLCPNTEFKLGVIPDAENACCVDGMSPLALRSNSRILCGADGKLENNCTIISGQFQVVSAFFTFSEVDSRVSIEGVTFLDSSFAALLMENDGDITYKNCAFKNHGGVAPVIIAYNPAALQPNRRRMLAAVERDLGHMSPRQRLNFVVQEYAKKHRGEDNYFRRLLDEQKSEGYDALVPHRKLQIEPRNALDVTFHSCLFEDNERGSFGGNEKLGVITSEGVNERLFIHNTTFRDNRYGDASDVRGYMIAMRDASGELYVTDSCFIDNSVIGSGLIIVASSNVLVANKNIFLTNDDDVQCPFVAVETIHGNGPSIDCIEANKVFECGGTIGELVPPGETDAPPPTPTPSPPTPRRPTPNGPTSSPPNSAIFVVAVVAVLVVWLLKGLAVGGGCGQNRVRRKSNCRRL